MRAQTGSNIVQDLHFSKIKIVSNPNKEKFEEILSFSKRLSDEMCNTVQSFYIWKTLYFSRSIPTVGKEEAEMNVKTISLYRNFFLSTEKSHLNSFIIGISKFFDQNPKALSIQFLINEIKTNKEIFTVETLLKIYPDRFDKKELAENYSPIKEEDKIEIEKLRRQHVPVIEKLKLIRDKQSAHTDIKTVNVSFIPNEVESLIGAIQKMLNIISYRFDRSSTNWDSMKEGAIRDTDFILKNLYRREYQRLKEIKRNRNNDW